VTCSTIHSAPVGFSFAGTSSYAPADEGYSDYFRAKDFPVWSSHQHFRKYSPRTTRSVSTPRTRLVTSDQPIGVTTGYLMPPSHGGKSLDRVFDKSPVALDRSLPLGVSSFTPTSRDDLTMPEHLRRLHQHRLRMAQDYPTTLTARAAYSDLAIASRTAPAVLRAERAAAEARLDAHDRDFQGTRDYIRAERNYLDRESYLSGLSPRGDFRFLNERRRMLAADLHLTDQQLRDALLLKTDPRWPGPNIWTQRGKAVYDVDRGIYM